MRFLIDTPCRSTIMNIVQIEVSHEYDHHIQRGNFKTQPRAAAKKRLERHQHPRPRDRLPRVGWLHLQLFSFKGGACIGNDRKRLARDLPPARRVVSND